MPDDTETTVNPYARWEDSFREQMVRLRTAAGMRQTDLARTLKERYFLPFHQQTIQRIETGERPIRLNEAFAIADVFSVSVPAMTMRAPTASFREMSYAVDRLRQRAGSVVEAIDETGGEYLEALDQLAVTLPEDVLSRDLDDLSPGLRWTMSFILMGEEAWRAVTSAATAMSNLSGEDAHWTENAEVLASALARRFADLASEIPASANEIYVRAPQVQDDAE